MLQLVTLGLVILLVLVFNLIVDYRENTFKDEFRIIEVPDKNNINKESYYVQQKNLSGEWKALEGQKLGEFYINSQVSAIYKGYRLQSSFPSGGIFETKEGANKFILELLDISKKSEEVKQEIIKTYEKF